VIERAKVVLEALEAGEREGKKAVIDDLPLFRAAAPQTPRVVTKDSVVEDRLKTVLPDELTPKEALALVYELCGMLGR